MGKIILLVLTIFIMTSYESKQSVDSVETKKAEIINASTKIYKEDTNKGKYEIYEITAYTANKESTGKSKGDPNYGITASGTKVKEDQTIACPRSMKFGTKIYIPFFDNTFTCEDRGGAIKNGRIDVYMEDLKDALEFGRRKLEVKVITD